MISLPLWFPPSFPILGRWTLVKFLGSGATSKVFLATDLTTNEVAAVKIFQPSDKLKEESITNEIKIHKKMEHEHIIQIKEFHKSIDLIETNGISTKVTAIVLECAAEGDMFNFLKIFGALPEIVARTCFHQIAEAVEFIHKKNIAHRDIKPENLLLDANLNIKLADFGHSIETKKNQKSQHNAGTSKYFSPEMHLKLAHSSKDADLFAMGIILFVMVGGRMPFAKAVEDDPLYSLVMKGNMTDFWGCHENIIQKYVINQQFSSSFKNLMSKMLHPEPEKRLSLKEVKNHEWYKGETLTSSELLTIVKSTVLNLLAFNAEPMQILG